MLLFLMLDEWLEEGGGQGRAWKRRRIRVD